MLHTIVNSRAPIPEPRPPHGKLQGLQVLRAVAALLVLWMHLKYNLGLSQAQIQAVPALATDLGAMGVDLFFVISGFVIAMTASKAGLGWRTFLAHRIARVAPLYFAVSTYTLAVDIGLVLLHHKLPPITFSQIFNSYAFFPVFDVGHFTPPLSGNGWTLSYEMWFYLAFALLMRFSDGRAAGRILPCAMTAGVLLMSFFYHGSWLLPRFLFHPLTLEFCAGCILYHARHLLGKFSSVLFFVLGLGLLWIAARPSEFGSHTRVLVDEALGWRRTAVWGGFAVCAVGIVAGIDLRGSVRWPRSLLLLGEASYSIYLVPLPLNGLVHATARLVSTQAAFWPFLWGIFYFGALITGGILTWKYIELPLTRCARNAFERRLAPPLPAALRFEQRGYVLIRSGDL